MKSLSIVMFTTFYPPYSFGGDAVGVQRLARALAAIGHNITVVHDEDAYLVSNLLTQQTGRPIVHGKRIQAILDELKPDIICDRQVRIFKGQTCRVWSKKRHDTHPLFSSAYRGLRDRSQS